MTSPSATEGTGPNSLEAAVLRIRDERGKPVGAGFLVSDELALTCAHVVCAALGIAENEEPAGSARLHVDLPLRPGSDRGGIEASVELWMPPSPSGVGDVAVLRLSGPLPGARPIRLVEAQDVWEHPVRAFGLPAGRPGGVWHSGVLRARQANGWVQVDLAGDGYRVSKGFSGTPVWDERLVGVVGMVVVAESGEPPVSYLIPTGDLFAVSPALRGLALPPSPFRSLSAFREADAAVFHGRKEESDAVAGLLTTERWVTVVGASGSGKSSLAMAGVIPRLRADDASAVVLRPTAGSSPLSALAAVLLPLLEPGLPETERLIRIHDLAGLLGRQGLSDVVPRLLELRGNGRLLVVVDQFEELLALAPEAVDELAAVLFDDTLPETVRVLTTLRADFLETALAHPRLGSALSRRVHALGPLGPDRLREVVTAPVDAIPGVRYEPHLAARILADTGTEPGALPLLGFTLDLLWRRQRDGLLTHQAYEELGGVSGALGDHADQVWKDYVPATDETAARRLLTRLIRVPIGLAGATRRVAPRTELSADEWRIAQRLAATRLLVIGRTAEGTETVELAHEALIGGWDKLATWAAKDRSFLVWRESLRHDKDRWEHGEHDPELLPTTAALDAAEQWMHERGGDLSEAERDYLEQGRRYRESRARRWRLFRSALAVVVVAALVFGSLFFYARHQSQGNQARADSRALTQASQDEATGNPVLSVMLAMAAYRTSRTQEARNQLLRGYLTYSDSARMLSGLLGSIGQVQTSRDGEVVFARSTLGRGLLFVHAATGAVRSEPIDSGQVRYAMVSANGKRAAYVDEDGSGGWFEVDADAAHPIGTMHPLPTVAGLRTYDYDSQRGYAMSADGRMIVVRTGDRLTWWNLDRGAVGGSVPMPKDMDGRLWIGPDDRTLLSEISPFDGKDSKTGLVAIDMVTRRSRTVVAPAKKLELLPSGDRTAVVICRQTGEQGVLSLQRITDGARLVRPYRDDTGCFEPAAADPTGHRVVLKSGTGVRLVDLDRGVLSTRTEVPDDVTTVSPDLVPVDGRQSIVGQGDSQIVFTGFPRGPGVLSVSQQMLTTDGSKTISVLSDGSHLQLRPSARDDDRLLAEVPRPKPYWSSKSDKLQRSSDGRLFADRESTNVVSIREVATLRETARITAERPPPGQVTFNYFFDHTGHLVTVSGTQIQQWDTRTGRQLAHFDTEVFHPRKNPDGTPLTVALPYPAANQMAVVTEGDPVVHVVDITTGRMTTTVKTTEDAVAIQFDPSGRYFGLLRGGSVIELWRRGDPPKKELGPLRSVASNGESMPYVASFLDREGHFMVAANDTIRIYQVGKRAYADTYDFPVTPSTGFSFTKSAFIDASADGKTVLYADATGTGGPLVLDPALWQRKLCDVIGDRTFTVDERNSVPVPIPAGPVCG